LFDGDCKNLPITAEIGELMPNAVFIHIVRRPHDFIQSGLARGYYKTTPHELWGHLCSDDYVNDGSISLEAQIEKIAYFWNEANRIAEAAKQRLGAARVTTLVAETMFRQPEAIVHALERIGLEHVVRRARRYSLRKLNRQKWGREHTVEIDRLIDEAVRRVCTTCNLYYD
jgi:hypothetical protein